MLYGLNQVIGQEVLKTSILAQKDCLMVKLGN